MTEAGTTTRTSAAGYSDPPAPEAGHATAPGAQTCLVCGDVDQPERRHFTREHATQPCRVCSSVPTQATTAAGERLCATHAANEEDVTWDDEQARCNRIPAAWTSRAGAVHLG